MKNKKDESDITTIVFNAIFAFIALLFVFLQIFCRYCCTFNSTTFIKWKSAFITFSSGHYETLHTTSNDLLSIYGLFKKTKFSVSEVFSQISHFCSENVWFNTAACLLQLPEEVKYLLRCSAPSSSSGLKAMSTPRCLLPWPLFSLGIPAPCPAPPTTEVSLSSSGQSLSSVSSSTMSQLSSLKCTMSNVCDSDQL